MYDIFADTSYGKAALAKLAPVAEGFMLFSCGWLGDKPEEMTVMKCVGAVFREAKSGRNKGKRTIRVEGTQRTAYLTPEEVAKFIRMLETMENQPLVADSSEPDYYDYECQLYHKSSKALNDHIRANGLKLYEHPQAVSDEIGVQLYEEMQDAIDVYAAAGVLPLSVIESWEIIFKHWVDTREAKPAQRITEQDVRLAILSFMNRRVFRNYANEWVAFESWIKHEEGRDLLTKLNEHREPEDKPKESIGGAWYSHTAAINPPATDDVYLVKYSMPGPNGRINYAEAIIHFHPSHGWRSVITPCFAGNSLKDSRFAVNNMVSFEKIFNRDPVTANKAEVQSNAILNFLEMAQELIDDNPYLYPEIARTRTTDWMAHILERPNGNPIITGQGLSPEEACQAAINSLPPLKDGE